MPRRRPPPYAPGCGVEMSSRTGEPPHIVSPAPGRTYALHAGGNSETVPLQAGAEADVRRLYWFAGKTYLGAAGPHTPLAWQATPGTYSLTVLDDHGRSGSGTVTMQSVAR